MIRALVHEAVTRGANRGEACKVVGVTQRTLQRWKHDPDGEDRRAGPKTAPKNKLSRREAGEILRVLNTPEFRDLPPKIIVPLLAERGVFLASESTMYRILRKEGQLAHRASSRPPTKRHRPAEHTAAGRNQVWSWDITYLKSPIRGVFYYLYVVLDVWSRKIVGWAIHEAESAENGARLVRAACAQEAVDGSGLVLHADNGAAMKGATMLATLQTLGVVTSFSRPSVSNDNPYSESQFRTTKYCPMYPEDGVFASLDAAHAWMVDFERWYNTIHRHSGIGFVTPEQRHQGADLAILAKRRAVYADAKTRHPERWSRDIRDWNHLAEVTLNPTPTTFTEPAA